MKGKNLVVINGRHYDAITGVAVSEAAASHRATTTTPMHGKIIQDIGPVAHKSTAPATAKPAVVASSRPQAHTAHAMHKKPQKSQTLHRAATKKPVTYAVQEVAAAGRSPLITKFGANNSHIKPVTAHKTTAAPVAMKAISTKPAGFTPAAHVKTPVAAQAQNSKRLKEQLTKEKLQNATPAPRTSPIKQLGAQRSRVASIATMSLAVVVLGGYLTYVNMPNLSVRVASARAGVNAQFPEYHPDGYSFNGPVAYSPGEVSLRFNANGSAQGYEIKQRASNWDSQAVLDNVVARESSNYLTYSVQGLTVYTYSNKAAWVNGGVLYTIDGNASLSSDQILHIASSL